MRFVAYALTGAVVGCSIGAAAGFFGWLEYARINRPDGVAVGFGAAYFGSFSMLITGAVGAAIGAWRAWLFRKRAVAAPFEGGPGGVLTPEAAGDQVPDKS